MISKITEDQVFIACLCGKETAVRFKDLKASEEGVRYSCEHCKRRGAALCYDGPMSVDSGPDFERHKVNQILYRRLVDAKQFDKDTELKKTPLAVKWKKGGEVHAPLHAKVIAQQRAVGTMDPKPKPAREALEKEAKEAAESDKRQKKGAKGKVAKA